MKRHFLEHRWFYIAFVLVLGLLCVRFYWSYFTLKVPLGYDPGIYRYLFVKHAEGWPPFYLGDIDPWSRGHPLGLFMIVSYLIKFGVPVDWFIGWIWNAMPIALLLVLAATSERRAHPAIYLLVLFLGCISLPYYDGFVAMYWKTHAALIWMCFAFVLIEKWSNWAILPAVMTLITHHQTGLLFLLCVGSLWILSIRHHWRQPQFRKASIAGLVAITITLLVYIPIFKESVLEHVTPLLTKRGDDVASGAFPAPFFYVQLYSVGLFLGIAGFIMTLKEEKKFTLWHLAALWSAVFVICRLMFYRRFFLHLDFFLLPFSAVAVFKTWHYLPGFIARLSLIFLLGLQSYFAVQVMQIRTPLIDEYTFELIQTLDQYIPENALVVTGENVTPLWIKGWLPHVRVGGPGLMQVNWPYKRWEKVMYGTHSDRLKHFSKLQGPMYFVDTPVLISYYGEHIAAFLSDPCFEKVEGAPLRKFVCKQKKK